MEAIKQGNYQVQPILGIEIPKGNGKTRLLGVPTTTERVLQQALAQTIAPLFEPEFSNHSYGFRPHKNARQAVGDRKRTRLNSSHVRTSYAVFCLKYNSDG